MSALVRIPGRLSLILALTFASIHLGLGPDPAAGVIEPATLPARLNFKVMVSTYENATMTQNRTGLLVITRAGARYGNFSVVAGGRLNFNIPTNAPTRWTLSAPGMDPRHFRAAVVNGALRIYNEDRDDRAVIWSRNDDGSYALEYYQERLYVCNQGDLNGPIIGRLKVGDPVSSSIYEFQDGEEPRPGFPWGGPEDNFGGTYSPDEVVAGVVRNVRNLPGSAVISRQFNEAIRQRVRLTDNRVIPYSFGAAGATPSSISPQTVPGLVFQWVYAGNRSRQWQLSMPATGGAAASLQWRTLLGTNATAAPLLVVLRRFASQFLTGLTPGNHTLRYWLVDSHGRRSNARSEVITIR